MDCQWIPLLHVEVETSDAVGEIDRDIQALEAENQALRKDLANMEVIDTESFFSIILVLNGWSPNKRQEGQAGRGGGRLENLQFWTKKFYEDNAILLLIFWLVNQLNA